MLPRLAFAEEAGGFELVETRQLAGRHLRLLPGQHFVHLPRRGKRAVENQVREVLLVFESVGLRQYAAIAVAQQRDLAQVERDAHILDILDHRFHCVLARILQALRLARAPLVDEDEPMRARQRKQPRQKVGMIRSRPAVHHHERRSLAERHVVDQDAMGIDVAFLLRIDRRRGLRAERRSHAGRERERSKRFLHGGHRTTPLFRVEVRR